MSRRGVIAPADLAACRRRLRDGSRSFALAAGLLPASLAAAATGLYAFCRVADDAIDEAHDGAGRRAALTMLERRLDRAYGGRPEAYPEDRALAALVAAHRIPRALPAALLEGFAWDAAGRRYQSLGELEAYGVRVAGTVGMMLCLLMGERRPRQLARACDLGIAMQLTNIARDVGEDAACARLYLPAEWLAEQGLEPDRWLQAPRQDPRIAALVARLLARADVLYCRADAGIEALPWSCRLGIRAARGIYADIGRVLAQRGFDGVSSRAVVGAGRKVRLLAAAALPRRGAVIEAPAVHPAAAPLIDAVLSQPAQPPASPWVNVALLFMRLDRRTRLATSHGRALEP